MCGIAGIFDPKQKIELNTLKTVVENMITVQAHRGPDDEGHYVTNGVGIGACRLKILDLTQAGHMPMQDSASGCIIVYNGEVYNYKELRSELESEFFSNTDTEVVLRSYIKWGEDCVKRFNGMFAFAIWDPKKRKIFCARDRIGIKPFYYATFNGAFYFASEIKGLFAAGIQAKPNHQIIYDYLAGGVYEHSNQTFFDNIYQLGAGNTMTVNQDGANENPYWELSNHNQIVIEDSPSNYDSFDHQELEKEYLELLADSVKLRLRSDVPIALNLSAGLDSASLMLILNKVNRGQGILKAFNFYFGSKEFDESPYAKELTRQLGWDAEYFRITEDMVPPLTSECMFFQEQPFPGLPTLGKHFICKMARQRDVVVTLEGQGGDEIGGGYQYMMGPHILDLLKQGKADIAESEIKAFAQLNGFDINQTVKKIFGGIASYYKNGYSADGTYIPLQHCLNEDFFNRYEKGFEALNPFKTSLQNIQYRDILYTKLPRILRSCDRTSMGNSIELRVPILDHRVVEFSFSLPGSFKINKGVQRYFMRESLKRLSNNRYLGFPKRAIVDPQRFWLQGPLKNWVQDVIYSKSFSEKPYFNAKKVQNEYIAFCNEETPKNSVFIWQCISMELWHNLFINGEWKQSCKDIV